MTCKPERPILVCSRVAGNPAHFADDLFGVCSKCGEAIRFRPHSPSDAIRVCGECMPVALASDPGDISIEITQQTRDELSLFYSRPPSDKRN
jgi:hypothetical protein